MDLKLKFVGIKENDVIATSCNLSGDAFRFIGSGSSGCVRFDKGLSELNVTYPKNLLTKDKYYHIIENAGGYVIDIVECDNDKHWKVYED